jgi:hypothetical protein
MSGYFTFSVEGSDEKIVANIQPFPLKPTAETVLLEYRFAKPTENIASQVSILYP